MILLWTSSCEPFNQNVHLLTSPRSLAVELSPHVLAENVACSRSLFIGFVRFGGTVIAKISLRVPHQTSLINLWIIPFSNKRWRFVSLNSVEKNYNNFNYVRPRLLYLLDCRKFWNRHENDMYKRKTLDRSRQQFRTNEA